MFSNGTIPYRKFIKFGYKTTFSDFVGRNQVEILGQENLRLSKSSIPPIIPIIAWFGATLRLVFKLLLLAVTVRAVLFVCIDVGNKWILLTISGCWWQNFDKVRAQPLAIFSMLVTEIVTSFSKLSPTHIVTNIRHQHRCTVN